MSNKDFKFFDDLESFGKETIAPRSNCILDTSKVEQYIKIRTAQEALEDALSKYKDDNPVLMRLVLEK